MSSRRTDRRLLGGARSSDEPYRYLGATLDPGFVREWVNELYAERDQPSIDPLIFCKLQLVMFREGICLEPATLPLFDPSALQLVESDLS